MLRILGLLVALCTALAVPAQAADSETWDRLRTEDGLVVLMRHALAPGTGDPPGFQLTNCATQRNLSAEGRRQARAIGQEFTRQRVPVTQVRSSRWCRARDTARLLNLGPVTPTPALDSAFTAPPEQAERQRWLTERIIRAHRDSPGVLVLVGHQVNITDITGLVLDSGESAVVRADARGRIEVLGTVSLGKPAGP